MNKLKRLFRHLTTTTGTGRALFPDVTLEAVEHAIMQGERMHRAEVRVIVEPSLAMPEVWNGTTARERACALFAEHRIWDTEENSGVLIYINLADHKVEIVADRGVRRFISPMQWQNVCDVIIHGFKQNQYHDAILAALDKLNTLLEQHLPDDGATANQLPNRPLML